MTKILYNLNIKSNSIASNYLRWITNKWKSIPLIDRWLFLELLPPLLFSISAFTVVSLSVGVMFELVRKIVESGLPPLIALQVLLLRLPGFLVISFPMATLMATLLAYSRLSGNSELKALHSLGVQTRRIISPAICLAVLMTMFTFMFNDFIVPKTNRYAEVTLNRALGKSIATEKGDDIIYSRFGTITDTKSSEDSKGLTQLFYAKKFRDRSMKEVTILDFSRLGYIQMLIARKGTWNKQESKWEFIDGRILTLSPNGNTTTAQFDSYLYPLTAGPTRIAKLPKDANKMTVAQAIRAEKLYLDSGNIKEARKLKVRIQEKFTLPMAFVVFGLIGSSLGAKPNTRTSNSQGFGISVVLILFYYVLSFSFSSMGVKGTLSPFVAAWSPVVISLLGGSFLLKKASQ